MNLKGGRLDYFQVECVDDEQIELVTAEYGIEAFAIIIKIFQKIYGGYGYYCTWSEDVCLVFCRNIGKGSKYVNKLNEIVRCCARRGIFSEKQYKENGILTSKEIQENFLNATSRRKIVEMKKAYLLVKVANLPENVNILDETVCILQENANSLKQSRVKDNNTYISKNPPEKEDIERYIIDTGLMVNADKFYYYHQQRNWRDKNGQDIHDWKATLNYWNALEKDRKMKKDVNRNDKKKNNRGSNQFSSFPQRDMTKSNFRDLEQTLLKNKKSPTKT